jgi:hypothetical protein
MTQNFLLPSYITCTAVGISTKIRYETLYLTSLRYNKVTLLKEIKILYTRILKYGVQNYLNS